MDSKTPLKDTDLILQISVSYFYYLCFIIYLEVKGENFYMRLILFRISGEC